MILPLIMMTCSAYGQATQGSIFGTVTTNQGNPSGRQAATSGAEIVVNGTPPEGNDRSFAHDHALHEKAQTDRSGALDSL